MNNKNIEEPREDISCPSTEYKEKEINNLKESLKDIEKFKNYLEKNNFQETFELIEYVDSGVESNVYHISNYKKNNRILIKNIIMKVIFHSKKQGINKEEINISTILKNINIVDFYIYSKLEENKTSYMLTEYAKYGDLHNFQKKLLKRQYLSESIICFFVY